MFGSSSQMRGINFLPVFISSVSFCSERLGLDTRTLHDNRIPSIPGLLLGFPCSLVLVGTEMTGEEALRIPRQSQLFMHMFTSWGTRETELFSS
jgi:hypothetical protein